MNGSHHRTLQRALVVVGTKARLAASLDISEGDLERYMGGEPLPHELFIEALDIVARGEHAAK